MSEPIKVLQIAGAMYPGGLENFIMNLFQNTDSSKVQFDFVIHARKENDYVPLIEAMGSKVYLVPRLTRNPIESLRELYCIVKNNQYKVVVRHTSNALIAPQLLVARLAGAKTICHSHTETDSKKLLHVLGRMLMGIAAKEKFACSEKAGYWMYGKRKFRIVHNAVDIHKFEYSADKEQRIRDEFGLGNSKVYGHIGNLVECKNHVFLISVFHEIAKTDPNARLICVGEGEHREVIEEQIERLQLKDKVILTGRRMDAQDFMSCFDVMIFPSVYEGLPLTLIEAQAAGLPCLISDTITSDVVVTQGLVEKASIEKSPEIWAKQAVKMATKDGEKKQRRCQFDSISEAGYDIGTLAKWYEEYFQSL